MNVNAYSQMQKAHYEGPLDPNDDVVGNYAWHENFPYETLLLYEDGDVRKPLFPSWLGLRALDFACGPGRMTERMAKLFTKVDGVDISEKLVAIARQRCPGSEFWVSDGTGLGQTPKNSYDFIYSTIALQHIAVHEIRQQIFRSMKECLKPGGKVTLQMEYSATYPYVRTARNYAVTLGAMKLVASKKNRTHARWLDNKADAAVTNSGCDVVIVESDLPVIQEEFSRIFGSCKFWLYEVGSRFSPPFGPKHAGNYWPTHWLFIHAHD